MKLLLENKRYIVSTFLTILMVFGTSISGYANNAPVFTEGARAIRTVAENTAAGTNIGEPVAATDADGDVLTYTKGWLDSTAFSVDTATGQIRTKAPLDYETKNVYSFSVFANDGNGGRVVILVTINVTDVDETPANNAETPANNAPVFAAGSNTTRTIAENTASGRNIGTAIAATDADSGDTLTYSLSGTDAAAFSIVSASGQLQTKNALDYETKTSYSVRVSVSDSNGGSASIEVAINVTDVNETPNFPTERATRTVAENTAANTNIGDPFQATDPDNGDTLTYSLHRGDASAFRIDASTGQLQTKVALDFETKNLYNDLAIRTTDSEGNFDAIFVTITVTNVNEAPVFTNSSTTRTIAENTASGTNIGAAFAATDVDSGDTLTYTLGGIDASAFSIVSTTGQLQTKNALDYETKTTYSVTVSVSDSNGGRASIDVTINVTDVNENRAPVFSDGDSTTRVVAENTASGENIGTPVAATDPNSGDTLTYTLDGDDAAMFNIVTTSGQLQTHAALDYETKNAYSVTVTASDDSLTDTITVTINVRNVNEAPTFTDGSSATRAIAENTDSGTNIGAPVAATDPEDDAITYRLGGNDAAAFSIISTSGQLQTRAALDFEVKNSYSVTVSAAGGNGGSTNIPVTISVTDVNEAPSFPTETATRTVAENTAADTNIGDPFQATDPDTGDTLTYSLHRGDATAFRIDANTGQLRTKAALDFETKNLYNNLAIRATDSEGNFDAIFVTINVTNVNEAPNFPDDIRTARTIAENTASGTNIGAAFAATDVDTGDTLTYSLDGADAAAFRIVSTTGQLQTSAALDYETQSSYSVTVTVSDSNGGSNRITVTINITDVSEFLPVNQRTPEVRVAIVSAVPGVSNADDVTAAHLAEINRLLIYGKNITSLKAGDFSGLTALTELVLYITSISDISSLKDLTAVTTLNLHNNAISDISVLEHLTTLTDLNLSNNAISDISALEDLTALTTLSLNDNTISDISALEDLTNLAALYLPENSISDISALEDLTSLRTLHLKDNPISDYGPLLRLKAAIEAAGHSLSMDYKPPVFTDGSSTTRTIAENTATGTNIGTPVAATDADNDTLTYSLDGDDAAAFRIVSTSGQLQTSAALDYETQSSYSVTVSASDVIGLSDSITVTINITDANEALPSFTDGDSTTRAVAENAASGESIGLPVTATDADDDDDTLTYSLGGDDAASFSIVSTTGQLQTRAALDYETQSSYSVTVSVSDGRGGSDSITVTINVMEGNGNSENRAPVFSDGTATTRVVAENTASGQNIGTVIAATDADTGDTSTYTLSGTDAAAFRIVSTSGQLQTKAALDYETKSSYSVTVSVSDSKSGSNSITVTIYVSDIDELGFVPVQSRSPAMRAAIVAAVPGISRAEDVTARHLASIRKLTLSSSGPGAQAAGVQGLDGQVDAQGFGDQVGAQGLGDFEAGLPQIQGFGSIFGLIDLTAEDFSGLTGLKRFWADHQSIAGISGLSSLKNLEHLTLTSNSIRDISALRGLTKLKWLYLNGNYITDISALSGLSNLVTLYLQHNNISSIPNLSGMTSLATLYLQHNNISSIADLSGMTNLTNLQLQHNDITDISHLSGLTKLLWLRLNDNNITDISHLSGLTKLLWLYLENNSITVVSALSGMTKLDELQIAGNSITDLSPIRTLMDSHKLRLVDITVPAAPPSVEVSPVIPDTTALLSNYPNPFNPETWIPYQLATPADVTLTIYDIRGVVVRELKLGHQLAGMYHSRSRAIHWDGRNGVGEKVATGIYFYTLKAGDFTATRKLLIRK